MLSIFIYAKKTWIILNDEGEKVYAELSSFASNFLKMRGTFLIWAEIKK